MVNHDIVRLNIPMHYAHAVTIVQGFQQLVQIEADVIISQRLIQKFEVSVVDMFKNQCRCPRHRIFDNCLKSNDVRATSKVFQNLYFSLDLLLFHWL